MLTEVGDVSEILKRDQRTIKNALVTVGTIRTEICGECRKEKSDKFSISRFPVMFFRISNLGIYTITDIDFRTFSLIHKTYATRINLDNFLLRLVQVFIFGVCLLSVARIPTAMSAPASCRDKDDHDVPKWKNPCGQELLMDNSSGGSSSGERDTDIIDPILTAAKVALEYMRNFRENYVRVTFQSTYDLQMEITKHGHEHHVYLPNRTHVPYHGEKVAQSHLESRRLDQFLQNMYEWMQMYAVGIEQVVLDQQKMGGKFKIEFSETESNLRKVLCELRMGMYNKNITPENKVERCIMDDSKRNLTETAHRNLRDWIILRECIFGLDYLIQVLEYLYDKSS